MVAYCPTAHRRPWPWPTAGRQRSRRRRMLGQPDAFEAAMRITGGSYRPSTGTYAAGFATSCRASFLLPNILAPGRPCHKPSQVKRTGAGPPIASSASDDPAIQLTTGALGVVAVAGHDIIELLAGHGGARVRYLLLECLEAGGPSSRRTSRRSPGP